MHSPCPKRPLRKGWTGSLSLSPLSQTVEYGRVNVTKLLLSWGSSPFSGSRTWSCSSSADLSCNRTQMSTDLIPIARLFFGAVVDRGAGKTGTFRRIVVSATIAARPFILGLLPLSLDRLPSWVPNFNAPLFTRRFWCTHFNAGASIMNGEV